MIWLALCILLVSLFTDECVTVFFMAIFFQLYLSWDIKWFWNDMQNIWNCSIPYILLIIVATWQISTSADDGNDSLNGHIISTTVGGKNGKPKQVFFCETHFSCKQLLRFFFSDTEFVKNVTWIFKCYGI